LAIFKPLTADFPDRPEYSKELANTYNSLGSLLQATPGRSQDAEQAHAHALAIFKPLAADFPDRPQFCRDVAMVYHNLGNLFRGLGKLPEAERAYTDALAIKKPLAAKSQDQPDLRRELAMTYWALMQVLRRDRPQEAEKACREVLAIYERLAADFPKVADYRNELASTLVEMADMMRALQDFTGARRQLQDAQPHHQAALQANPNHPSYRACYRAHLTVLARICAGQGDHAAAFDAAAKLRDLGWDAPADAYDAACALALCLATVEKIAKAGEQERNRQVHSYGGRAVALLREAVARGYKDAGHMRQDEDLAALRDRPDFRKLLTELENSTAPKP
jgi:tetratricopeptide (TPR) repeat protein